MAIEIYAGGGDGVLQSRTITPSTETQSVKADVDDGYEGLRSVTVKGDENLLPQNIRNGVSIFNVNGEAQTAFYVTLYLSSKGDVTNSFVEIPLIDPVYGDYSSLANTAQYIMVQPLFGNPSNYPNPMIIYGHKVNDQWSVASPYNVSISFDNNNLILSGAWKAGQYAIYIG